MEMTDKKLKIDVPDQENIMPSVGELLKILLDVNMEQNNQSVSLLVNYMDQVEESFYDVLQELETVKIQLNNMQKTPVSEKVRNTVGDMNSKLSEQVSKFQNQIKEMKQSLNNQATQLIEKFEKHGVKALNNVCEFLGIKEAMINIKESLNSCSQDMEKSIDKIDKVKNEFKEATTHVKNVGRVLVGKDVKEPETSQKGFFERIKVPYQGVKKICDITSKGLEKSISKLDELETKSSLLNKKDVVKKSSIKEKLDAYKETQNKVPVKQQEKVKKQETSL